MVKTLYCWRCDADIPMLEENEWKEVAHHLEDGLRAIKEIRENNSMPIHQAKDEIYGRRALQRYFELTGHRETNVSALWHHRVSLYGPPCGVCGKPLRTRKAKMCAAGGGSA